MRRSWAVAAAGLLLPLSLHGSPPEDVVDPTRPPPVTLSQPGAAVAQPQRLSSVLIGPHRRLAVVDDQLLAEGQSAAGLKLIEVAADRVVVRLTDGSTRTLLLDPEPIRKDAVKR